MGSERLPRKLAAILYADVAGYSRLTGEDEDATHRTLSEYLDVIATTIENHRGRVMHYAGDAVLAMFEAVVDALTCAAHIQSDLATRNKDLADGRKVEFRVGVNLGDVIEDRDDIYGDGVNVAARLEGLAEPGGVCISGTVYDAVGTRLSFDYDDLGEQQVKNIREPVRAFHARLKLGAELPTPVAPAKPQRPSQRYTATAIVLLLIVAGGVLAWLKPWVVREQPVSTERITESDASKGTEALASVKRMAFPLPDKPSIAVLPFTNMSDDPTQEYFVDGMTEDLITDLSKISGLFTIARNSVFTYKGKPLNIRQVAEELGVRYVLEGSVRRAGEKVRINAQLIDATTGGHLWAERYDGSLTDVFALQDNVTEKIVTALKVSLTAEEQRVKERKETDDPEAYDAFLEGWTRYRLYTPEDFGKAASHFKKAIELDPNYARAHAALAAVYAETRMNDWPYDRLGISSDLLGQRANQRVEEAMKNPTPLAHRIASLMLIRQGRYDDAIAEAERGIVLNPNDPNGHGAMARALILAGRSGESLAFINKAIRLDPRGDYQYWLGVAQFHLQQYDEAVAGMRRYAQRNTSVLDVHVYLAAAYGHLGRKPEAKAAFETLQEINARLWPNYPFFVKYLQNQRFKDPAEIERLREGLAKAGISSKAETVAASSDGITLKKGSFASPQQIFLAAKAHCRKHGKHANLKSVSPPTYVFSCS